MKASRRGFLAAGSSAALGLALDPSVTWGAPYRVGVGRSTDPYTATTRAIDASAEWPAARIAGRTVVIKPNLIAPYSADTGAVTHPEVVRALVDRALADGALAVLIVETSRYGAFFEPTGYGIFSSYDPLGRVSLVDLGARPLVLAPVAGGLAYSAIWTPAFLLGTDVVFISAAKMKTHAEAMATLVTKNLFGIPGLDRYVLPGDSTGRFTMHERGLHETVADILRLRPIDYGVVDAVVAMEGMGPINGNPVAMNTVLAGRNSVAVDRVALQAMTIPQQSVPYLTYAARLGLGPLDLSAIDVYGDPLTQRAFALPIPPPLIGYPRITPAAFNPSASAATIVLAYGEATVRQVHIVQCFDDLPATEVRRILVPRSFHDAGFETVTWDGRGDDGLIVPPGRYAVQVRAWSLRTLVRAAAASAWVTVNA
jgi:uncharacterized protein (DUF362 family)